MTRAELQAEYEAVKKQRAELQAECEAAKKQRAELRAECEAVKQQLADSQAAQERLATMEQALASALSRNQELRALTERLEHEKGLLHKLLFAPKTERRTDESSTEPNGKQGWLFLAELVENADRLAQETGATTSVEVKKEATPRQHPRRRSKFPKHLPRVRTTIELPEGQRQCCGQPMEKMKQEVTPELERIEVTVVHEIARDVYICRQCQDTVKKAPAPDRVIDRGLLGVGFQAHLLSERFGNHQPYHRLEKKYQAEGLDLSRTVLCQTALRDAELLEPIYEQIKADVLQSFAIHTDETPVNLQKSSSGGPRKARVWTYLDREGRVFFDFTETRSRDGPESILKGYTGYIHADAASTFDGLFLPGGATEVACWAHGRRYFVRAEDSDPELSREALAGIRALFAIEEEAKRQKLSPEEIKAKREREALPRLEEFRAWLDLTQTKVLPKSPMGRAIQYCLNQWQALTRYLEDGRLSLDNNPAERMLRAVGTGRKNWVIIGNERGGHAAAILYSLVMTCKSFGVDPKEYFRDVLLRIGQCSDVTKLTPYGWKEHFAEEVRARRDQIVAALFDAAGGTITRAATA